MLFMVIEHFTDRDAVAVYRHLRDRGRGLPAGLRYVDSWVSASLDRCFQLMECDDPAILQQWVLHWGKLARFEFVPVAPSAQTREVVAPLLDVPEPVGNGQAIAHQPVNPGDIEERRDREAGGAYKDRVLPAQFTARAVPS